LQIASIASGLGWQFPMTTDDENVRRAGIEANKKALQIAAWLGTDALLWVPGGVGVDFIPNFARVSYDNAMQRTRAALRELKSVAESVGVTLAIENVWNKFLLSPLEMRDLIDQQSSTHIGVYFDCGNVLLTGYPEDWIRILGHRIARVHLKDFKKSIGTLDGFCPLLQGDVDYAAAMKALRAANYNGALTAEYFSENDLEPCSKAIDKILEM
jgi:L-ribulose-5-phosphate 3-epimerase